LILTPAEPGVKPKGIEPSRPVSPDIQVDVFFPFTAWFTGGASLLPTLLFEIKHFLQG
jgi:hypothetical protein